MSPGGCDAAALMLAKPATSAQALAWQFEAMSIPAGETSAQHTARQGQSSAATAAGCPSLPELLAELPSDVLRAVWTQLPPPSKAALRLVCRSIRGGVDALCISHLTLHLPFDSRVKMALRRARKAKPAPTSCHEAGSSAAHQPASPPSALAMAAGGAGAHSRGSSLRSSSSGSESSGGSSSSVCSEGLARQAQIKVEPAAVPSGARAEGAAPGPSRKATAGLSIHKPEGEMKEQEEEEDPVDPAVEVHLRRFLRRLPGLRSLRFSPGAHAPRLLHALRVLAPTQACMRLHAVALPALANEEAAREALQLLATHCVRLSRLDLVVSGLAAFQPLLPHLPLGLVELRLEVGHSETGVSLESLAGASQGPRSHTQPAAGPTRTAGAAAVVVAPTPGLSLLTHLSLANDLSVSDLVLLGRLAPRLRLLKLPQLLPGVSAGSGGLPGLSGLGTAAGAAGASPAPLPGAGATVAGGVVQAEARASGAKRTCLLPQLSLLHLTSEQGTPFPGAIADALRILPPTCTLQLDCAISLPTPSAVEGLAALLPALDAHLQAGGGLLTRRPLQAGWSAESLELAQACTGGALWGTSTSQPPSSPSLPGPSSSSAAAAGEGPRGLVAPGAVYWQQRFWQQLQEQGRVEFCGLALHPRRFTWAAVLSLLEASPALQRFNGLCLVDLWSEQLNGVVVSRALLPRLAGLRTLVFDSPNVGLDEWFWVWLAQSLPALEQLVVLAGPVYDAKPLAKLLCGQLPGRSRPLRLLLQRQVHRRQRPCATEQELRQLLDAQGLGHLLAVLTVDYIA